MTLRIGVLATLLTVFLLAVAYRKRANAHPAQPVDTFADENAKWDKRIDELQSFYAEEKASSRLGKR